MKVLLIDVDSKIPNLALMKLSAYRKKCGDTVGFYITDPDFVYVSIIYEKNFYRAEEIVNGLFKKETFFLIGGTGYDISMKLPDDVEKIKPDYDLYPSTYSQGFTTRGCIRKCPFCLVPKKEGNFRIVQHPKEFHDDRFDTIMIMDNNWLANEQWFQDCMEWIIDSNLKLLECGLDIRLLTHNEAKLLSHVNRPKNKVFHFAFDNLIYKDSVKHGIRLLIDAGLDIKRDISFYVYLDNGSDIEFNSALERIEMLRNIGTNAYLMYNIKEKKTRRVKDLERWTNNRYCYWKTDFNEYIRSI